MERIQGIHCLYDVYLITSDKSLMKQDQIHSWLSRESYWAAGISLAQVKMSFEHSFCVGVMKGDLQIGYCRLITDYSVFGYLADVYVIEEFRRRGLCTAMLRLLLDLKWVTRLQRIMLATLDAHRFYEHLGFSATTFPERFMEINRPKPDSEPSA